MGLWEAFLNWLRRYICEGCRAEYLEIGNCFQANTASR